MVKAVHQVQDGVDSQGRRLVSVECQCEHLRKDVDERLVTVEDLDLAVVDAEEKAAATSAEKAAAEVDAKEVPVVGGSSDGFSFSVPGVAAEECKFEVGWKPEKGFRVPAEEAVAAVVLAEVTPSASQHLRRERQAAVMAAPTGMATGQTPRPRVAAAQTGRSRLPRCRHAQLLAVRARTSASSRE